MDLEVEISKTCHMEDINNFVVVLPLGLILKGSNRLIDGIPLSSCLKDIQKYVLTM